RPGIHESVGPRRSSSTRPRGSSTTTETLRLNIVDELTRVDKLELRSLRDLRSQHAAIPTHLRTHRWPAHVPALQERQDGTHWRDPLLRGRPGIAHRTRAGDGRQAPQLIETQLVFAGRLAYDRWVSVNVFFDREIVGQMTARGIT